MTEKAYITKLAKFLPNEPIPNEEMEKILGVINGKSSRSRRIVLRQNGIKNRYYAIDEQGRLTHSNAALTAAAVKGLLDSSFDTEDIELLCCGTSIPDQFLPSHAVMVQGVLGCPAGEVISTAGVCCSGMYAMKYGMLSIMSGNSESAVCTGSELVSPLLHARHFQGEMAYPVRLEAKPILAFEKDFLRWMLSDGAGAALLRNKPTGGDSISLRIDWIDSYSFADRIDTCMYAGLDRSPTGAMVSWKSLSPEQWFFNSVFSIKQEVALLEKHVIRLATESLDASLKKHGLQVAGIDYFLPHISSEYFRKPLESEMKKQGISIPQEKWFTNLSRVGNIGSASIYLMLEELFHSGELDPGMTILAMIPESARFSYIYMHLTVC
ncbi:MAG: beta-ketoacyl-ACP synthase III [Deltaproteobacteria bacterium]|nr:beta-ketoacyl-ACP synthase III [Deltaproteobacteria bacterium]